MNASKIFILVLEDDIDDFYITKSYLRADSDTSYILHHATSISVAISILEKENIDLILTDLNLEDSEGIHTLKTMISHSQHKPVIALTDMNEEVLGKKAIQEGAADYLPKKSLSGPFLIRAISYALERQRLIEKLKQRAEEDPLTLIPNRSALFKKLVTLIEQAKRRPIQIAILMIDLDGFKAVNDTHGHLVGDEILKQVSKRLSHNLRQSDMIARIGGDEFIMLVTNYKNIKELQILGKDKLELIKNPFHIESKNKKYEICISASIGCSEWRNDISAVDLVNEADSLMYQSKNAGKNRFTTQDQE